MPSSRRPSWTRASVARHMCSHGRRHPRRLKRCLGCAQWRAAARQTGNRRVASRLPCCNTLDDKAIQRPAYAVPAGGLSLPVPHLAIHVTTSSQWPALQYTRLCAALLQARCYVPQPAKPNPARHVRLLPALSCCMLGVVLNCRRSSAEVIVRASCPFRMPHPTWPASTERADRGSERRRRNVPWTGRLGGTLLKTLLHWNYGKSDRPIGRTYDMVWRSLSGVGVADLVQPVLVCNRHPKIALGPGLRLVNGALSNNCELAAENAKFNAPQKSVEQQQSQ
eukprot:354069-Chlamydomonas_euryale.AAC.22